MMDGTAAIVSTEQIVKRLMLLVDKHSGVALSEINL
jgi:hypothetical protein